MTTPIDPEDTSDQLSTEDIKQGVTAGYDLDQETWHVEVHRCDQPVEIIRIVAPQVPDEKAARTLAEQVAENLGYRHIDNNTGLTPAADLVELIRAAAWMEAEDDASLLEEIVRLRVVEARGVDSGWSVTNPARIIGEQRDGATQYAAAGLNVVAIAAGVAMGSVQARMYTPDEAREAGAALIAAAKRAEKLAAETAVPVR